MPLGRPLSVAPAFLPFLWRRGFTFLRERRRSLKNVKRRRQRNGRKAGATDRGRIKGMGIGGWV